MELGSIEFGRWIAHLERIGRVLMIVGAVAEQLAKVFERSFCGVGDGLLLSLFECSMLLPSIFGAAVADVLVESTVTQSDSHDAADASIEASTVGRAIEKVDIQTYNGGGPAIEAKDFVGQVDELPTLDVGQLFAATWTGSL